MRHTPHLLKIAIIAVGLAPCLSMTAFLLPGEHDFHRAFIQIGLSFLLFGCGEILNHPLQTGRNFTEKEESQLRCFKHRYRHPCILGNLLDIIGLLIFFTALTTFISF